MIRYTDTLDDITPSQLEGILDGWGWPNPPDARTLYRVLAGSYRICLALDDDSGQVVGFIQAISDGVLAAYIPLLKVRTAYQGQGIGLQLTERLIDNLRHLYMIDLLCEEDLQPFYEKVGMSRMRGMALRFYENQSGAAASQPNDHD